MNLFDEDHQMQSGTSNLHSRAQHPTAGLSGQLDTMYEKEKPKGGFRSSYFYRSRIRGFRCNGLIFSVSFALVTLCIYYLAYWRDDGGGVNEMGKGGGSSQVVFEDMNPKFDGLNRRVEVDRDDVKVGGGGGGGGGLNSPPRKQDQMGGRNQVTEDQVPSDEDRYQPQDESGVELNDPQRKEVRMPARNPVEEEQVPRNDHQFKPQVRSDSELNDQPIRVDKMPVRQPVRQKEVPRNDHQFQPRGRDDGEPHHPPKRDDQIKKPVRDEQAPSNDHRYHPRGRGGAELNDRKENRIGVRKPVKEENVKRKEHRHQKHESFYQDEEEDEIYDGNDGEDGDHRIQNEPRQVYVDSQHGNRHGNVHAPQPKSGLKSFEKSPPKVIPIGPDNGLVFNHHDRLNNFNPDDIAPKFHDVLGKQPNQQKNNFALQVPVEVDPDYLAVARHNMNPQNKPKLPKFKPYKHINPQPQDFADMKPKPNPKNFPVTLLQRPAPRLCPSEPFVLILVLSQAHETVARKTIRKTWGTPDIFTAPHIRAVDLTWWVVFAIGTETTNTEMELENANNHDILQGDFVDIEAEETRKVMMTMKWLYELKASNPECRPAYVLKTGSHVFVNAPVLTSWIKTSLHQATNLYIGNVIRNDDPVRDPIDPHFVPYYDFKDEYFPTLVRGPTYMLSTDVIYRMVPLFGSVTPIAMDDSYIGLLASKLEVRPRNDNHFVHPRRPSNVCHYKSMMLIFGVSPAELRHIFNVIMGKTGRHCLDTGL